MMSFSEVIYKHKLKNKATSNIKIYEVLKEDKTRFKSGNLFGRWGFSNKL